MKKPKPVSQETRALLDAMASDDSQQAPADKLEEVKNLVRELRKEEIDLKDLEERVSLSKERINQLKHKTIVDKMDEIGINKIGIDAEGNLPRYDIETGPYYHANIAEGWEEERKAAAYTWLEKNKHGDLIKATYSIQFGRGEAKLRKAFESLLKKSKTEYAVKLGVPWNTLTSFVKEQIEVKKVTPPLEVLGATVGRVAKVVNQKKERK